MGSTEKLVELIEELMDLVELHSRNNLNLCLMGGMTEILCLIFSHESDAVRKAACRVFGSVVSNNPDVQDFAAKSGAINLAGQLEREATPQMREAVLGCLSACLKAANFPGKRAYISQCGGLEQLSQWIRLQGEEEVEKYGQGAIQRKIKLKLKILLYDLVLNDDGIKQDEPFYVRDTVTSDEPLLQHLLDTLKHANLQAPQEGQLREYTMNILYRLYQRKTDLKPRIEGVLGMHQESINAAIPQMPDRAESLQEEL